MTTTDNENQRSQNYVHGKWRPVLTNDIRIGGNGKYGGDSDDDHD